MFAFIKDLVSGVAAFFRFSEKKQDLANSPEMQANARAKTEAEIHEEAVKAVESGDLETLRKLAADK